MGRRVVLVGDLNIARDEIDSAHAREAMSKAGGVSFKELSKCRMMFDRLLEPHQEGVMVDLCRRFWPERRGMYTCWEQRERVSDISILGFTYLTDLFCLVGIQARPGNYGKLLTLCSDVSCGCRFSHLEGARIDYVCCSLDMKSWFSAANIQEGLMVGATPLPNFLNSIARCFGNCDC